MGKTTESTSDKLLKKMVLSYDLHKNQAYVDRLLKEGEIQGYKNLLNIYEKMKDNEKIGDKIKELIPILEAQIKINKDELCILKAQEKIFNELNKDLENNLVSLDINSILEQNKSKYPLDVQARINKGKCALKRPGRGGFICNNPVVEGSKYCKEHLKKYDKIRYTDLISPEEDENE